MKIISDSGAEITPTKSQKQAIMTILLQEKEKVVSVLTNPRRNRRKRHIMGSKTWTNQEDEILKSVIQLPRQKAQELANQFARTPNAIAQRHSKLKHQHELTH